MNIHRIIPDAGRVAPISARASSNAKRKHQALPPNASSNGGDASRVGIFFSSLVLRRFSSSLALHGRL